MVEKELVIVALSGGVDSAVSALLLRNAGYRVECLHMSNWEDDGYCESAKDFQDARRICQQLNLPLHRVNFTDLYKKRVFSHFLDECRLGRTPNPDVLCNKEIKFGALWEYAKRLGGHKLATGHYARTVNCQGQLELHKGLDPEKDQSYFLHAVKTKSLTNVLFPLGDKLKSEVRDLARSALLPVSEKKDSTGICFIGERPFSKFLSEYVPNNPGKIKDLNDQILGEHQGLQYYTLGQRQGLGIGGLANQGGGAWYVSNKKLGTNELIVVQGNNHPSLFKNWLKASAASWVNDSSLGLPDTTPVKCWAKSRYRQTDQACTAILHKHDTIEVYFDKPQRAITPGQYVVLYQGTRCLGGATIDETQMRNISLGAAS
jgi:tRNA-specific 2-thiouridylase